jgi:hypothetical protein
VLLQHKYKRVDKTRTMVMEWAYVYGSLAWEFYSSLVLSGSHGSFYARSVNTCSGGSFNLIGEDVVLNGVME